MRTWSTALGHPDADDGPGNVGLNDDRIKVVVRKINEEWIE